LQTTLAEHGTPEADVARRIRKIVELAIDHTSRLARDLATVDLSGENLMAALHGLAAQTRGLFDVCCHVSADGDTPALDPTTAHHIYKIAQEAVTNAIKHGQANAIEIVLASRSGEVALSVRNDGGPFPDRAAQNGMGLRYMRHRASVIGATLAIRADGDRATVVRCALPVASQAVA